VRNSTLLCLIPLLFAACQKDVLPALVKEGWRVITIAPSTAANIQALGMGSLVVGVSDWCAVDDYSDLPRIGGLGSPSLERISELQPNVVIVQGRHAVLEKYCRQNGIYFMSFTTDSLDAWRQEIRWLGDAFNCSEKANSLINDFGQQLQALGDDEWRPRCLLVAGRKSNQVADLLVAAQQSFLTELLEAAGGINVLADDDDYIYLQEELLPELNPQIIFELHFAEASKPPLDIWEMTFPHIDAVDNGRIYNLFNPQVLMPGPNMVKTAQAMSDIIQRQKPVQ
jgi:iron complex transport system substrate-binding protein